MPDDARPARRPPLRVRDVPGMGRGVFARRAVRAGEVIEVCPVLVLPGVADPAALGGLQHYVFKWAGGRLAVALGYGSLYNHSADPNAAFARRRGREEIVFRAVRAVAAGEQIFIDYEWDAADYAGFERPAG